MKKQRGQPWKESNKKQLSEVKNALVHAAAVVNVANNLAAYKRTGNSLHVWRSYLACRTLGIAPPEQVMELFDSWALALESCTSAADTLHTLGLSRRGGGRTRKLAADSTEKQLNAYLSLKALLKARKEIRPCPEWLKKRDDVFAHVAEKHFLTPERIKQIYAEFSKATRELAVSKSL